MGHQLSAFYDQAFSIAGYRGKVELARLTKVPSSQAEVLEDTPLLIQEFEDALLQLKTGSSAHDEDAKAPKRDLMVQLKDVKKRILKERPTSSEAAKMITELLTSALAIERSSVWTINSERTAISCVDLFSTKDNAHTKGTELSAEHFPAYFKAIRTERTIAAHNAHTDPHTKEFSDPYLKPLGINSLLDVPIWSKGRIYGVLCQEHTGPARRWTAEEEDFAYAAGSLFGLVAE